ncbi:MAG: Aspartyl/glutamyl-tRNA(Asn/Gln) amidotransferase subunit B [Candidatus Nomurabacteria bacterium GW2011_GWF2_35_66]|uniref:Aspartyl/glutamyl-tRNA(Asn/Gln) amidotransferase subunit B n=1 Tax=Candidatus Nomurabacteria bacterium GW2011_GWE1_35_16 TaxID=1618761 RepID=A0A0G0DU71_9BACT|nr:MAG: Aspartyl/glutamyl-tRNA(Asn/Gln) amidotransferase subunit B [Candidatus Nomurabacteria bacterium GW2011_GWF1_34_20]KKP63383.1 MAG: Aspartyl/glutamyl-tRNA(Asn/Gln) amidotransferase subunit B [Candidatus Nomurabacteria bacterium GW2011_GWE2_34_25]KKP66575.1 MAG: Aspartyl/glutamyl-tRNA(Asn/Gln) amidotransferase subunit B [Candidatus Nomurabacteria bacterium GW2011_GWE1_35_16]KKP83621.1 MAG: Aspartyl/glutamyl-tRNA(Asn/Gln) amidotransferase subunit B [Candidatus Nomurabacteria bacterium GW2011
MSKEYYTTIGLEIHAELNTNSKMFCGCKNDPDEVKPNVNICPVCMAHPGTLPVINKKAVESVIKVGLALGANIADFTEFDRKNYFYPDIPKAYQISQYKYPIVSGGSLKGVDITRVHLEEDTATSKHDRGDYSLVDFNRCGVPLMELVTEPVIHSSKQAGDFGRELQTVLRYLGVSEANMEKGQMRVELNISISEDPKVFGTKVEVKNINSFKAMERAAEYEIKRMSALLDTGEGDKIVQETRGWDESKQSTFSQRKKENANDYRYFPDPDLPKLFLSKVFDIEKMRSELPELPEARRNRYRNDCGIKDEDIESYIVDKELGDWFEKVAGELKDKNKIKIASNYITSDYLGLKKVNMEVGLPYVKNFAELIEMVVENKISSRGAKDILAMIVIKDESPLKVATEKGLLQNHDEGALKEIIKKIIDANPTVVETYKGGKENAIMSLVGQVMKESKGSANPQMVQKLLKELLS